MSISFSQWQIWHTYSTFFVTPLPDLDVAAQDMVRSGLVECAVSHSGDFFWRSDSAVQHGHVSLEMSPDRMQSYVTIEPQVQDHFVLEAVFQAAHLRFTEMKQFGEQENFPPPYVRGFLGQCRLVSEEREILVYPIIKLHATGVVLLEMRIIGPDREVSLDEFVANYLNLYKWRFQEVWGSPGLAVLAQRGHTYYRRHLWPIYWRVLLLYLDRRYIRYAQDHTRVDESGDFEFELAPLWRASAEPEGEEMTDASKSEQAKEEYSFSELAHAIISATGIAISGLRGGVHLILRGQRSPLELGGYWLARPHIHVTRHHEQMETAEENEEKFGDAYGWIMGRLVGRSPDLGRRYLPVDARPFEDYGAYIAPSGSLWVWSQSGRRREEEWALPHDSHLVYENQSKAELLDYGYMLHRRLAAVVGKLGSSDEVLRVQQDLIDLKMRMNEASVFGEIRELLLDGWREMGVPELQGLITESLAITHAREIAAEEKRTVRWEVILTMVFGILAAPTLASELIEPGWEWLHFWRPSDSNVAKLFFVGVTLLVVMVGLLLSRWVLLRKKQ